MYGFRIVIYVNVSLRGSGALSIMQKESAAGALRRGAIELYFVVSIASIFGPLRRRCWPSYNFVKRAEFGGPTITAPTNGSFYRAT